MTDENKNIELIPEEQAKASDESRELNVEQLGEIVGGVQVYDDPRDRDHSNKKDDPKDW